MFVRCSLVHLLLRFHPFPLFLRNLFYLTDHFLLKKFPFYYTKRPPRFYLDDPLCNVIVSNLIRIAGPEKPYFPVFLFYMVLMDIRDTN